MSSTGETKALNAAVKKSAKEKKATLSKEEKKKPKTASHPPYFQEDLLALNEKGGSSPYTLCKYTEDKHNAVLPENLRKMLSLQLKNSAAKGKLTKVKASYMFSGEVWTTSSLYKLSGNGKKKPKKPARATAAVSTGGRKSVKKMTPAKAKQPKSIKSPAAKRARKITA